VEIDLRPGEILALLMPPGTAMAPLPDPLAAARRSVPGSNDGRGATVLSSIEHLERIAAFGERHEVVLVDGFLDTVDARMEGAIWSALLEHRRHGAAITMTTRLDRHAARCDRIIAFGWPQADLERELALRHHAMRALLHALLGSWAEEQPSAVTLARHLKEVGSVARALLRERRARAETTEERARTRTLEAELSAIALSDRVLDAIAAEAARFDGT
jgi:hypothetical protein